MTGRTILQERLGYPFAAAVRFLTILPWPAPPGAESTYFQKALYFFPLIGLSLGVSFWLLAELVGLILPAGVTAALLTVVLSAVSGFLHLDGLADTADGFMSGKNKERMLEIMRDSRIGVMGAAAVGSGLLIKYAALRELLGTGEAVTLVAVPLWSRSSIVSLMAVLPYARKDGGLGALFYSASTRRAALCSIVLAGAVLATVSFKGLVASGIIVGATFWWFARTCRKSIGGVTGDTLGAVSELTEMAILIALTIVI